MIGSVLVIGAGIAGIQASLDLANSGFKVYLVESKTSIGGMMPQLDKTFPTNDCSMCILSPKLVETGRHPNIKIITNCEIKSFEGKLGDFKVKIEEKPLYVEKSECTGCGTCARYCPVSALDTFNCGLGKNKAISVLYPQAVPLIYSINRDKCIGCGLCENVCLKKAIRYSQKPVESELEVGAIIISSGTEVFDPSTLREYKYVHPNIITSMEFERILSASGPYGGKILRPLDGKRPKKIGFIQCVGSRNIHRGQKLCSAVCCMYTAKEAIIAKEHDPELDITIFYIDIRAFGKGCEEFIERAKNQYKIKYIRCEVAEIEINSNGEDLTATYDDPVENKIKKLDLDMMVLSTGLIPSKSLSKLAKIFGLKQNEFGFIQNNLGSPTKTNVPGIYVCGTAQGPKDIPDSVAQASGAAARVEVLLASVRNQLVVKKDYPPEKKIELTPRIGVFVCHCGINIGNTVNVPEVVEYVKTLPDVIHAERNLYTCSQDTQENIKKAIAENNLNRVIVASCTPRTHEVLFRNTCREAGLNPYLFEFCNIREHCSWVHMNEKEKATKKAKDLIRMSVARSRDLQPLQTQKIPVIKKALVIGGGVSGMTAALDIANQGFQVYLVEKGKELGGFVKEIKALEDWHKTSSIIEHIIPRTETNPNITIFKESQVTSVSGFVGNFKAEIKTKDEVKQIEFGAAVIAVGAKLLVPHGYYHYGENEKIITQKTLEKLLEKDFNYKKVVMIQCVGSREPERPYCSRVCCIEAIKNAALIKKKSPQTEVFVLNKDLRSYGLWEALYSEARDRGVIFIKFTDINKPEVNKDNLRVTLPDMLFDSKLSIDADLVVLSSALLPGDDFKDISKMFKVPLDSNGFFMEAHIKLRPVDFATDGIFICGTAHYPKMINESLQQASATASRACLILSKDMLESEGIIAKVDESRCKGCGTCVLVCPYKAIELIVKNVLLEKTEFSKRTASINPLSCKGCGSCAAACPIGAITPQHFSDKLIEDSLEAALE